MTTRKSRALLLIGIGWGGGALLAGCERGFLHSMPEAEAPLCGPAPTELSATLETDRVVLRWTSTLTAAEGYRVERSAADGPWQTLAELAADAREHVDSALAPVGLYTYQVRGVRGPCTTEPSPLARVYTLPLPPTDVQAAPQDASTIRLTWSDPNGYEEGYTVEQRLLSETAFTRVVTSTGADAESYDVPGLAADSEYELRVAALRQGGGNSDWVTARSWTGPGTPGDLVVTTLSPTSLGLAWSAVANPHLTGFRIERRRPGYGQFSEVTTLGAASRAFTDSGLVPAATYDYRVYAEPGALGAVPAEASGTTSSQPQLAWAGAPSIDSACTLHVAGTVAFDTLHGASLAGADASVSVAHGSVVAGAGGFDATLIDPAPATLATSWTVRDDLGGASTLARDLLLQGVTPGLVHTLRGAPAATIADSASEGRQPWLTAREAPPTGRCGHCAGRVGALAANVHSCALVADGRVRCWGRNVDGQVGDGSKIEQRFPLLVCASGSHALDSCAPLTGAAAVTAGDAHTCALRDSGQVVCWGNNGSGRLGDGTITERLNPSPVCATGNVGDGSCSALGNVAALATGNAHNCALLTDSRVVCWGYDGSGQTGNGTSGPFLGFANPVSVCRTGSTATNDCVAFDGAQAVTAGSDHSCAIVAGGEVRCWGGNAFGELGNGETGTNQTRPSTVCSSGSVAGGNCAALTGAVALAAGARHTCALKQDGTVVCWGARDQIGDGDGFTPASAANPVPVCRSGSSQTGNCLPLSEVVAIAAGTWHSCAVLASGQVACWGWGWLGALGNGHQEWGDVRRNAVLACASGSTDGGDCVPFSGAAAVVGGTQYTCALDADQLARCWGAGDQGQLGDSYGGSGYTAIHPGKVCLTTVNNLCVPFDDAALRRCVELVVEVAP